MYVIFRESQGRAGREHQSGETLPDSGDCRVYRDVRNSRYQQDVYKRQAISTRLWALLKNQLYKFCPKFIDYSSLSFLSVMCRSASFPTLIIHIRTTPIPMPRDTSSKSLISSNIVSLSFSCLLYTSRCV